MENHVGLNTCSRQPFDSRQLCNSLDDSDHCIKARHEVRGPIGWPPLSWTKRPWIDLIDFEAHGQVNELQARRGQTYPWYSKVRIRSLDPCLSLPAQDYYIARRAWGDDFLLLDPIQSRPLVVKLLYWDLPLSTVCRGSQDWLSCCLF